MLLLNQLIGNGLQSLNLVVKLDSVALQNSETTQLRLGSRLKTTQAKDDCIFIR